MTAYSADLPRFGRTVLNRAQMRAYDAAAIRQFGLSGLILMENAARGATDVIKKLLKNAGARTRVVLLCGTGNNGGDGFVVARQLAAGRELNVTVTVFVNGPKADIKGDAKTNLDILLALGLPVRFEGEFTAAEVAAEVQAAALLVDALYGTGLSRPIQGVTEGLIQVFNAFAGLRVSLDLPSGLDADTGEILGCAAKATHTVCFAHAKPGLLTPSGSQQSGEITVVHTGHPDAAILAETGVAAEILTHDRVAAWLSPRRTGTFKHRSGDTLLFAGSPGKTGAAHLAALAALRSGAGLATIATTAEAVQAIAQTADEIMLESLPEQAANADLQTLLQKRHSVALGPGFGLGAEAKRYCEKLWRECETVLTVDADGITHIVSETPAKYPRILTPHSGEMARLLGVSSAEIERDRYSAVRLAAKRYGAVVVLKGAHTLVCSPAGQIGVSPWANAALATAGSGDVLTGITCALAAELNPFDAAREAVYLHGLAAHLWRLDNHSDRGMVASDIIACLPRAIGLLMAG